jgi:hypothetical protein
MSDDFLRDGDIVYDDHGEALQITPQGLVPLAHLLNAAINSQPVQLARGRPRLGGKPGGMYLDEDGLDGDEVVDLALQNLQDYEDQDSDAGRDRGGRHAVRPR